MTKVPKRWRIRLFIMLRTLQLTKQPAETDVLRFHVFFSRLLNRLLYTSVCVYVYTYMFCVYICVCVYIYIQNTWIYHIKYQLHLRGFWCATCWLWIRHRTRKLFGTPSVATPFHPEKIRLLWSVIAVAICVGLQVRQINILGLKV